MVIDTILLVLVLDGHVLFVIMEFMILLYVFCFESD